MTSPEIRYALITGAGSGIGLATAEHFLNNNWRVIAVGRTLSKLEKLQTKFPDSVVAVQCDLANTSDVANLISKVSKLVPQIKALINNAGIYKQVSFVESDDNLWREQFETNLFGSVRLTRDLLKLSLAQKNSLSIVNISSTLGVRPIADTSAYSASKAAMISWTKTLALEVAKYKIRVNCICPGIVDTPIHDFNRSSSDENTALRAALQTAQPIGRMGKPEDVAAGAYYLSSDEAAWVTGSVLSIDGGISL